MAHARTIFSQAGMVATACQWLDGRHLPTIEVPSQSTRRRFCPNDYVAAGGLPEYSAPFDPGMCTGSHCLSSVRKSGQNLATTTDAYCGGSWRLLALYGHTVCLPARLYRSRPTAIR